MTKNVALTCRAAKDVQNLLCQRGRAVVEGQGDMMLKRAKAENGLLRAGSTIGPPLDKVGGASPAVVRDTGVCAPSPTWPFTMLDSSRKTVSILIPTAEQHPVNARVGPELAYLHD